MGPAALVWMVDVDVAVHAHLVILPLIVLASKEQDVCGVLLQHRATKVSSVAVARCPDANAIFQGAHLTFRSEQQDKVFEELTAPGMGVKLAKSRADGGSALCCISISFAFLSWSWKRFSKASRSSSPPCMALEAFRT